MIESVLSSLRRQSSYSAALLVCVVLVVMVFFDAWKHRGECHCATGAACTCPAGACECDDCRAPQPDLQTQISQLDLRIMFLALAHRGDGESVSALGEAADELQVSVAELKAAIAATEGRLSAVEAAVKKPVPAPRPALTIVPCPPIRRAQ